jgi:renalase
MVTDTLVIGAGLSGLMAAKTLENAGKSVTVLDKGRSVGGRLATRRVGEGLADHGAQFFTVRTNTFQRYVDQWLAAELVYIWGYGWSDGSLKRTVSDGHPRYVTRGGMNNLAKHLAKDVQDVRVDVQVVSIDTDGQTWELRDSNGQSYTARSLVMTPPAPQALELVKNITISVNDRRELQRIQYGPCIGAMFVVEGDVDLPEPGAVQDFEQPVHWLADNQRKGISDVRVITVHAEARYSRQHYDDPDEDNLAFLRAPLEERMADGATITEQQLKKWRYSIPLTTYPRDCLPAEGLRLVFAGDAFGGRGRIEGAFLSGLAAGQAALAKLT